MESSLNIKKNLSQFITKDTAKKAGVTQNISRNTFAGGDPVITSIEYDSRDVKNGSLFFALPGIHTDGSIYIDDAIKRGALAVIHENDIKEKKENIIYLKVKNARYAMSPVSAAFYDYPSRRLLITGVTGTEGKSTTVFLIWQLLTLLGKKAGFFSTVQQCYGGEIISNSEHQTTPEAPVVQKRLWEMAAAGCEFAVVESSSHGLSKKTNRLGDVEFACGVLTNVTHEHLEFHGTWEKYRDDKANLFCALDQFKPHENTLRKISSFTKPFGVVNADDKSACYFEKATKHKTFKYSSAGKDADIILEAIESNAWGNWYTIFIPASNERINLRDKLPGAFNASNVLAAMLAVSGLLNIPLNKIAPFINKLEPLRGRMTTVDKGQPFEVVVDYAHTPSSFQAIFPPLRERLNKSGGRIISVFGSAGERDIKKRSEQGKIAADYSDILILTDEDPRGEKPMDILGEIVKGVFESDNKNFKRDEALFLIPDRPEAIRKAFSLARKGDLVLLLGKGHENSIIYAKETIAFDEINEAKKALGEMGFN